MAYYEGQGPRWTHQHGRQQSWDPSHGPQRSSINLSRHMHDTITYAEDRRQPDDNT